MFHILIHFFKRTVVVNLELLIPHVRIFFTFVFLFMITVPVDTPAETFVAQIFVIPLRNVSLSLLDTVIPANERNIRYAHST